MTQHGTTDQHGGGLEQTLHELEQQFRTMLRNILDQQQPPNGTTAPESVRANHQPVTAGLTVAPDPDGTGQTYGDHLSHRDPEAPGGTPLERAARWLTAWDGGGPVPYSQSERPGDLFHGYRRDCSGYASMALELPGPGLNTTGLASQSTQIDWRELSEGDLVINPGTHIVIFDRWVNEQKTRYMGYEQAGDGGTKHRSIPYPYYHEPHPTNTAATPSGYRAYRY